MGAVMVVSISVTSTSFATGGQPFIPCGFSLQSYNLKQLWIIAQI